jgi:hypothetical protein
MRAEKSAATKATTTTLALTRAMAATFFPDRKRVIKDNDALDWQHAVVSAAFCDFVLLDGATCDMVRRAQRMLPGVKMAKTFSESDGGIEHFIDTLGVAVAQV